MWVAIAFKIHDTRYISMQGYDSFSLWSWWTWKWITSMFHCLLSNPKRCWTRSLVVWMGEFMLMLVVIKACSVERTDLWKERNKVVRGGCRTCSCHSFFPCRFSICIALEITFGSILLSDACLSFCFFQALVTAGHATSDGLDMKTVICFSNLVMHVRCPRSISLLIPP